MNTAEGKIDRSLLSRMQLDRRGLRPVRCVWIESSYICALCSGRVLHATLLDAKHILKPYRWDRTHEVLIRQQPANPEFAQIIGLCSSQRFESYSFWAKSAPIDPHVRIRHGIAIFIQHAAGQNCARQHVERLIF